MDNRKLADEFSFSSDYQTYVALVEKHLQGLCTLEEQQQLSIPFQTLLLARKSVRSNESEGAIVLLNTLKSSADPVITAERELILGFIAYTKKLYLHGLNHYDVAAGHFEKAKILGKQALALFNKGQCLFRLGNFTEASELDQKVLVLADTGDLFNVKALVYRSLGYESLRQNELTKSLEFFKRSEYIFVKMGNLSDAGISFLYGALIEASQAKEFSDRQDIIQSLKSKYPVELNYRYKWFRNLVMAIFDKCTQSEIEKFCQNCDEDVVFAVQTLTFGTKFHKTGQVPSRVRISEKLITLLRKTNGATPAECIEFLWGSAADPFSLQRRLWSVVSRINRSHKLIYFDTDGRYRLL